MFTLNEGQNYTLEALNKFKDTYVLKGYAGTGKTTVITRWMQDKIKEDSKIRIVLTAPTNKATNVLREKAKEIRLPADVSTIHSLLKLKLKWKEGQQVLVQDNWNNEEGFDQYDYVVIDECGMLNEELMTYIQSAQSNCKNKVIYMGDPCQLPPIKETESRSFSASEDTSELTEIMRQGKGNPIQDLSLYLRTLILDNPRQYPAKLFTFVDDKKIIHMPASSYQEQILDRFALTDSEDKDVRHLAWTNAVVNTWNNNIRDRLYGNDRGEWMKGEQIVTLQPVMDPIENKVIFSTDTLLEIQREPEEQEKLDVPCWIIWAKNRILYVPKASGAELFNQKKKTLLDEAKKDKTKWKHFYTFMETFANIRPAHSLTVHRSQGSTFDEVYVSYNNILANPNRKESLQCLYVACTRASDKLYLI